MNKNDVPLVSILIPTFNSEKFVVEAIESALSQTYPSIEIVVVDNASTDKTRAILGNYAAHNSNVHVYQNEINIGPVRNWRRCAELAKGDFAVLLFSDDLLAPDFVSSTISYLSDISIGFAYSAVGSIDQGGSERGNGTIYDLQRSGSFPIGEFVSGHLTLGDGSYPLSPGCAIFRAEDMRRNLQEVIPDEFNAGYLNHGAGPDLIIYLMCALRYPFFAHVNERKAYFRGHENNLSKLGAVNLAYTLARAWFASLYYPAKNPNEMAQFRAAHLWRLMRLGRGKWYRKSLGWDESPWSIAWGYLLMHLMQKISRKLHRHD